MEKRKQAIKDLYKKVLEREADIPGLDFYLYSALKLNEIEGELRNSPEFLDLQKNKDFGNVIKTLGNDELLMLGSSPKNEKQAQELEKTGVFAVLDCNEGDSVPFDTSIFPLYVRVPLSPDKPITKEQAQTCISFIYDNVCVNHRKTFVHSDKGVSRAPMIVALFLFVEKEIPFKFSIDSVLVKQRFINPDRRLINSDLLEEVFSWRGNLDKLQKPDLAVPSIGQPCVSILDNLYAVDSFEKAGLFRFLKKNDISIIIDFNEKKEVVPQEASYFNYIHFPIFKEQAGDVAPVALRSMNKYLRKGKVLAYCSDKGILHLLIDSFLMNYSGFIPNVNEIRKSLMEL